MSESLNVLTIGRYEARVKVILATVMTEADRQWEIWNLSSEAQTSLRETPGLNENEPICNAVIRTSSNGMNGCAEPVRLWRRQYHAACPIWLHGHPGVTGQAWDECYPREDGRDCIDPVRTTMCMELIKRPNVGSYHAYRSEEVMIRIIGREIGSKVMQPVRQDHNRNEVPAMGTDAKGPDFCKRFANSSGPQIHPDVKGGV